MRGPREAPEVRTHPVRGAQSHPAPSGAIGSVARVRTVWAPQVAARWARQEKIGKGAFGTVWRVVRVSGGEGPTEALYQGWNSAAITQYRRTRPGRPTRPDTEARGSLEHDQLALVEGLGSARYREIATSPNKPFPRARPLSLTP